MIIKTIKISAMITAIIFFAFIGNSIAAISDVAAFEKNMRKKKDQTALTGNIESMIIKRPNAEFRLGKGRVALFDFGASRICAMVYEGDGVFIYDPPDDVEREQLIKFTDRERLEDSFKSLVVFFTIELDDFPDTSGFIRGEIAKKGWKKLSNTINDAFDHRRINIPNMMLRDLLSGNPDGYLYIDCDVKSVGHLVFEEDPLSDDYYQLYKLIRKRGIERADVLAGYSIDQRPPSLRNMHAIDITNYKIISRIENDGEMMVNCKIDYLALKDSVSFMYFIWYGENKIKHVLNSKGDTLIFFHKRVSNKLGLAGDKYEHGFGVVLDDPMVKGADDFITISYECKNLRSTYELFYLSGKASWYPSNIVWDKATYDLVFNCPENHRAISCGNPVESKVENDRSISRWVVDKPVIYVSFDIGIFNSRETTTEEFGAVQTYITKHIPHKEMALLLVEYGYLSNSDMLGQIASDVTNSLAFFTSMLGPCPFDTIRAVETFSWGGGEGSPGLIHLSWETFQTDDIEGYDEALRAHEVSHQWWGHIVDNESYRDTWIIEGLAKYCGLWFYQYSAKGKSNFNRMWQRQKERIFDGWGVSPGDVIDSLEYEFDYIPKSIGNKAGPVTMGRRLNSSKTEDYYIVIYYKGAYVFHMIRYLLHDYKTGSDDAFAAYLKDLVQTYRDKIITTALLQEHLEKHIGADMTWFFDQWVYGTAIPEYEFKYKSEPTADGKYAVVCGVKQKKVPDNFRMLVPITVLFEDDRYIHLKIWVDKPEADIELPLLPFKPKKIIFNTFDAVLCKVKYK